MNMNIFDQELYYWTHMLDEAFADIPQEQKIDMSKQFIELLRQFRINLNKDIANIIKTWFIADSETMDLDYLKQKYTQNFINEVKDSLLKYFEYKKSLNFDSVDLNGQTFILKNDQSIKMVEDRSINTARTISDAMLQLIKQQTGEDYSSLDADQSQKFEQKYQFNANDKKEIKLLGCTEHIACWRTIGFETTNKFIYYIWRNPEMDGGYGKYMKNSPFCTREKDHWDTYSHKNPEYEQFWFFKLPEGCQATSGNLNNEQVFDILNKMTGHGGELLVGLDDTYLDANDIEDRDVRDFDSFDLTSNEFLLSFYFYDYQEIDYSEEIKQFYGKILFTFKRFEFPHTHLGIASYKHKDDEISDEMNQLCQKINNKKIKSVVIPNDITSIDYNAFDGCTSLTSITIPNSVTSIGSYAFYHCKSLTSIIIPDSVTSIGMFAFAMCESLKSIIIPNSITSIYEHTFRYCESLTSIIIPNSVQSIKECAFLACTSLRSITIPNSVISIDGFVFDMCTSLTSIIVPDQNTADIVLKNNPEVKNLIKIQQMNESKYTKQQLLEAIDYWTKKLN